VGRDVLQEAGIDYKIYDALWGRKYEDNIVPEDDRFRKLTFVVSKFGLTVGDKLSNASVFLDLNPGFKRFDLSVRPLDPSKGYVNQWLTDEAKDYIGQTRERFISRHPEMYDIDRESHAKTYDLHSPASIEKDFKDGARLLKVLKIALSPTPSQQKILQG